MVFPRPISSARITLLHLHGKGTASPRTSARLRRLHTQHSSTLPAPGVSQPVQSVQLVIAELQVLVADKRRLFLQSHEPGPLLQHLKTGGGRNTANYCNQRDHVSNTSGTMHHITPRTSSHLAVFGGDGFTRVPVAEAVDAQLELLSNQSAVLPAALGIRQAHPLAQILRLIGGWSFVTMS